MAKKTIEKFYSDLSGKEIDGNDPTISFSFDGASYDIDLTRPEIVEFEKSIATYVGVARKSSGSRRARSSSTPGHDPKVVRAWARENGHDVPSRGRIPGTIVDAYNAAEK